MSSSTPDNNSSSDRFARLQKMRAVKFSRTFLLVALLATMVLFINMVKIFLLPILLAAVFSALFYPFYQVILKGLRDSRNLSAFAACLILLLGLLIPLYFIGDLVSREALDFYATAEHRIRDIISQGDAGLLGTIKNSAIVDRLQLDKIDWQTSLQEIAKTAGSLIATVINETYRGTFQLLTSLFVTLFTMFYFFRDGEQLVRRLKYLSPLDEVYEEALIFRFVSVARATIKGTLVIGLLQGTLGGLTLWLFDFNRAILWGVVMLVLSIIPMVGAWLVLYPAALISIFTGEIWQGIAILLIAALGIGNIDNFLRPRLVGRDAGMHDLMIFFSTLGGISVFGITGFIVGPVIAVLFLTILDIYSIEFRSHLDLGQSLVTDVRRKKGRLYHASESEEASQQPSG